MRLYVILGDPVRQVKLPELFNERARQLGLDWMMVMARCSADDLGDVMGGLHESESVGGVVVTVPHKVSAARLCDTLTPTAAACGSVNVARRGLAGWHGHNVDGLGFFAGLSAHHEIPQHARVDVIGGGGAGVSIAAAFLSQGATVRVAETSADRRHEIADLLQRVSSEVEIVESVDNAHRDLIVNATANGMNVADPLPLDLDAHEIDPRTIVADIIMEPAQTLWLDQAERLSLRTHQGRHMLEGQLNPMFDFLRTGSP